MSTKSELVVVARREVERLLDQQFPGCRPNVVIRKEADELRSDSKSFGSLQEGFTVHLAHRREGTTYKGRPITAYLILPSSEGGLDRLVHIMRVACTLYRNAGEGQGYPVHFLAGSSRQVAWARA